MSAATASIAFPITAPTSVAASASRSGRSKYAGRTSTSSEMPRFVHSSVVSSEPSTLSRSGTGSIPHRGVSFRSAPFAGANQSRFDGCDLSAMLWRTPARVGYPRMSRPRFLLFALAGADEFDRAVEVRVKRQAMRRAGVMVLAAAIAIAAAGCGGGGGGGARLSKSEYEQKMSSIGSDLQAASSGIDLTNTKDLDKVADAVAAFRTRLDDAADKIADALHAFAGEFEKMEKAARKGNLDDLQKAQQAVLTEGAEAQKATQDLKDKGYDIGKLGSG